MIKEREKKEKEPGKKSKLNLREESYFLVDERKREKRKERGKMAEEERERESGRERERFKFSVYFFLSPSPSLFFLPIFSFTVCLSVAQKRWTLLLFIIYCEFYLFEIRWNCRLCKVFSVPFDPHVRLPMIGKELIN